MRATIEVDTMSDRCTEGDARPCPVTNETEASWRSYTDDDDEGNEKE
jgi:hypothetical protein